MKGGHEKMRLILGPLFTGFLEFEQTLGLNRHYKFIYTYVHNGSLNLYIHACV